MVKVLSSALNSVSSRFQCYLLKGLLKQDFLDIYLTMFFAVRKFKNTSAMTVIFFPKIFKIESKFRKCKKKKMRQSFSLLRSLHLKILLYIVSIKRRILVISSQ